MKKPQTTRELARAIADEVLRTFRAGHGVTGPTLERAADAVIDTLHKSNAWFCRGTLDEHGITIGGTERRLP